jgi:hypothetical protein
MNKLIVYLTLLSISIGYCKSDTLEMNFKTPPDNAKPHTFWHWMNGHISKDGISKDLEAMKRAGLGGFMLWNTTEGTPKGSVDFMSDQWWKMLKYTISESNRLGLEMSIFNCGGWSSSGGPWVTPDMAMQEVVWTEKRVMGPQNFDEILDIPEPALGIERDMARNPEVNKRYYVPREKVRGYYKDIALLAFPTPKSDKTDKPFRLENWKNKAGFSKMKTQYSLDKRKVNDSDIIQPDKIIVLNSDIDSNGRLKWKIPSGEWTILRVGYQPTGRQNHPAPAEGTGLEIDKFSSSALELQWKNTVEKFITAAGNNTGKSFKGVHIDSYEVGHQNWNVSFYNDFLRLRGYDLLNFLPTLTGRIVNDIETTEKFLWDYRKTISDLIARNYYGRFAELSRENKLKFSLEPYGEYGNTDDFIISGIPEIPVCEFWALKNNPYHTATAKLSSSAAHTYGRKIVGAEAFTGAPEKIFEEHPYAFKAQGDYFFCRGINQFSYHTFTHDPYNKAPGFGLGTYGSHFDSRNTWWPYVGAYLTYVSRCQYLLQQGQFVADMLYFVGEDAPQVAELRENLIPSPPVGVDYDFCNRFVLEQIVVRDGQLVLPDGMSYRMLVLPNITHMRPEVLNVIERLVASGATVIGPKPIRAPSLADEGSVYKMTELADRIWGKCDGINLFRSLYGKGRIYWNEPIHLIISELNLKPDFSYEVFGDADFGPTFHNGEGVEYIHKRVDDIDIYFVSNQHHLPKKIQATFRIKGRIPELWHPENGTTEHAAIYRSTGDGRTTINLNLDPAGSVFVIFRRPMTNEKTVISVVKNSENTDVKIRRENNNFFIRSGESGNYVISTSDGKNTNVRLSKVPETINLSDHWQVFFPSGHGAPDSVIFPKLMSLSEHEQYDVKHFSGTAIYKKEFVLNRELLKRNQIITLDLGDVQVIAEVWLNGKNIGVLWKTPYAVDVTNFLRFGSNQLEIKVANLWVNRLIGDRIYPDNAEWTTKTGSTAKGKGLAKIPDWVMTNSPRPVKERKAFVAWQWPHLQQKDLLPSGLIGPVRLVTELEVLVK